MASEAACRKLWKSTLPDVCQLMKRNLVSGPDLFYMEKVIATLIEALAGDSFSSLPQIELVNLATSLRALIVGISRIVSAGFLGGTTERFDALRMQLCTLVLAGAVDPAHTYHDVAKRSKFLAETGKLSAFQALFSLIKPIVEAHKTSAAPKPVVIAEMTKPAPAVLLARSAAPASASAIAPSVLPPSTAGTAKAPAAASVDETYLVKREAWVKAAKALHSSSDWFTAPQKLLLFLNGVAADELLHMRNWKDLSSTLLKICHHMFELLKLGGYDAALFQCIPALIRCITAPNYHNCWPTPDEWRGSYVLSQLRNGAEIEKSLLDMAPAVALLYTFHRLDPIGCVVEPSVDGFVKGKDAFSTPVRKGLLAPLLPPPLPAAHAVPKLVHTTVGATAVATVTVERAPKEPRPKRVRTKKAKVSQNDDYAMQRMFHQLSDDMQNELLPYATVDTSTGLDRHVEQLVARCMPTAAEETSWDNVIHRVTSVLRSHLWCNDETAPTAGRVWHEYRHRNPYGTVAAFFERYDAPRIHVFGSAGNGFALSSTTDARASEGGSDIDLCLEVSGAVMSVFGSVKGLFRAVEKVVRSYPREFTLLLALPFARIPLLSFKHLRSGITVDISFENVLPRYNTHLLNTYGKFDARVRALILLIKLWAGNRGINDAPNGTISSYSHTLLGIFFLQRVGIVPSLQHPELLAAATAAGLGDDWAVDEDAHMHDWDRSFVSNVEFANRWWTAARPKTHTRISTDEHASVLECMGLASLSDEAYYTALTSLPVSKLFVGYLDFYARSNNLMTKTASVRSGVWLEHDAYMSRGVYKFRPWQLSIEDPFDYGRDLGVVLRVDGQHRMLVEWKRARMMVAHPSKFHQLWDKIKDEEVRVLKASFNDALTKPVPPSVAVFRKAAVANSGAGARDESSSEEEEEKEDYSVVPPPIPLTAFAPPQKLIDLSSGMDGMTWHERATRPPATKSDILHVTARIPPN